MKNAIFEPAEKRDGVVIPVECLEMKKMIDTPDLYAHFHEFLEMLYLQNGRMQLWLNDKLYDFMQGEFVIINSNETHRLISLTDISEYLVIKFTPRLLYTFEQSPKEKKYVLPFLDKNSKQPRVYSKQFTDAAGIPDFLYDALREWKEGNTGYELALKADVLKTIRCIVGYLDQQGINVTVNANTSNMQGSISMILDYINNNFRTVSEKDAADKFNISYSYFSRSFKHIMNMSFKEYINYLKINEAQKLLVTTDKNVTDIAMELGFSSSSHFINVFRKLKDCSPKQYKKTVLSSGAESISDNI